MFLAHVSLEKYHSFAEVLSCTSQFSQYVELFSYFTETDSLGRHFYPTRQATVLFPKQGRILLMTQNQSLLWLCFENNTTTLFLKSIQVELFSTGHYKLLLKKMSIFIGLDTRRGNIIKELSRHFSPVSLTLQEGHRISIGL